MFPTKHSICSSIYSSYSHDFLHDSLHGFLSALVSIYIGPYLIDNINLPLDPPPHHPQVGLGQSSTRCAACEANRAVAFLPSVSTPTYPIPYPRQ